MVSKKRDETPKRVLSLATKTKTTSLREHVRHVRRALLFFGAEKTSRTSRRESPRRRSRSPRVRTSSRATAARATAIRSTELRMEPEPQHSATIPPWLPRLCATRWNTSCPRRGRVCAPRSSGTRSKPATTSSFRRRTSLRTTRGATTKRAARAFARTTFPPTKTKRLTPKHVLFAKPKPNASSSTPRLCWRSRNPRARCTSPRLEPGRP
mmetsp:Transcript_4338/g.17295  ORF Transcript_4338/g.17295 Transcript_4338/m.17295 type:complete len:210 (+) Transcript_4338:1742-2371(+)